MRWVPDLHGRWHWRCKPGAAAVIVAQLTQRSTIVAIINALVLLVGWQVAPEKVEALGTLLSAVDAVVLALIQECPPPPPPPADGCPS